MNHFATKCWSILTFKKAVGRNNKDVGFRWNLEKIFFWLEHTRQINISDWHCLTHAIALGSRFERTHALSLSLSLSLSLYIYNPLSLSLSYSLSRLMIPTLKYSVLPFYSKSWFDRNCFLLLTSQKNSPTLKYLFFSFRFEQFFF